MLNPREFNTPPKPGVNRPRRGSLVRRLFKQNSNYKNMKNCFVTIIIASALTICVVISRQKAQAQDTSPEPKDKTGATIANAVGAETNNPPTPGSGAASQESSPIFLTEMPPGYRDWRLISVAHEEGSLNDIRAILGNDIAIKAYREGKLPFPEGSIIARVAWSYVPSEENNKIFGRPQSFVAGPPKNGVQFMLKDSTKYASTGGWGSAHFNDGKSADEAVLQSCFPCHQAITSRDLVFTRYSP